MIKVPTNLLSVYQCAMQLVSLNTNFFFLLSEKEAVIYMPWLSVSHTSINTLQEELWPLVYLLSVWFFPPGVQFDLMPCKFISGDIPNKSQGWVFSHVPAGYTSCLSWLCSLKPWTFTICFLAFLVLKIFHYSFYCFALLNLIQP